MFFIALQLLRCFSQFLYDHGTKRDRKSLQGQNGISKMNQKLIFLGEKLEDLPIFSNCHFFILFIYLLTFCTSDSIIACTGNERKKRGCKSNFI